MQKTRALTLAACLLTLAALAAPALLAGQAAPGPAGPGRQRRAYRDRVEDRLQRMSQRLNLTEDQKEKIRPVLQDESKQLKALHEDTSLTPEQRRAKAREIHRATREQINPILTPEQQEQLKEMHRRRPRGTGQGQGPGGPQKP